MHVYFIPFAHWLAVTVTIHTVITQIIFCRLQHLYSYRCALKASMSCSSFLSECADSSQVSSLEICSLCDFKSPGLPMISSGYHGRSMSFSKISTINNCCLRRQKHVFKEYKTREHLDLGAFTLTWSTQWSGMSRYAQESGLIYFGEKG